jgi:hypothetical protein
MSESATNPVDGNVPATPSISASLQLACDIAAGRAEADPGAHGFKITGAMKDLTCRGRGPQFYRMVYRGGAWQYVSAQRLPNGCYRARERRAEVFGDVFIGEIVVDHNRGAAVDTAYLVDAPDAEGECLENIAFQLRRDGDLTFTLPDGSEVVLTNPRSK